MRYLILSLVMLAAVGCAKKKDAYMEGCKDAASAIITGGQAPGELFEEPCAKLKKDKKAK